MNSLHWLTECYRSTTDHQYPGHALRCITKYARAGASDQSSTKALKFIDKAISLDQRHAFSHFVRGKILLDDRRPDYAGVSFFRSNEIEPTIATYEGLVDAYLEASKEKEKDILHIKTARDGNDAASKHIIQL